MPNNHPLTAHTIHVIKQKRCTSTYSALNTQDSTHISQCVQMCSPASPPRISASIVLVHSIPLGQRCTHYGSTPTPRAWLHCRPIKRLHREIDRPQLCGVDHKPACNSHISKLVVAPMAISDPFVVDRDDGDVRQHRRLYIVPKHIISSLTTHLDVALRGDGKLAPDLSSMDSTDMDATFQAGIG